jgi:3-phenylpropionate/trans-cinnamate dioxygenase ferredoxin reductase component
VTNKQDVVIVGGGLAAVHTAQALRQAGHEGRLRLVSNEACLPYDRPPLSKNFLLGKVTEAQVGLLSGEEAAQAGIELVLGRAATGLDRVAQALWLHGGERLVYEQLVVATGARPLRLAALTAYDNVHVLRTLHDASRLRTALLPGARLAILGAGFIGLEIASVARALGCEVTVIEMAQTPLTASIGAELGACVQRWHERKGVRFLCGTQLLQTVGDGRVHQLQLSGGVDLPVDAVVVGIGQTPNTEWLADTGLALHRGALVCDALGRTADARVFGVGDAVCRREGEVYLPSRHWTAATEQASRTARALCGEPEPGPWVDDHYFWSDQHGSRLQFAGHVAPDSRVVWAIGGPDEDRFVALCCDDTQLTAVFSLGSPRDFLTHSMALRNGERVPAPVQT